MNEALLIETFPNYEVDLFGDGGDYLAPSSQSFRRNECN